MPSFAETWKELPCLGYTHFQPAQLVTVGKRASLWCHELVLDLAEIERRLAELKFLGVKGTTGTQASFLALFDGDRRQGRRPRSAGGRGVRVRRDLTRSRARRIRGRSTPRSWPTLAGVAESAHRFGSDLRLLAHEREIEEPFEAEQIGSSAMAYKRNPMRAERMCSLARFVHGAAGGRQPDRGDPVAGAHARRQRGPPPDRAPGFPGRRRDLEPVSATSCRDWSFIRR